MAAINEGKGGRRGAYSNVASRTDSGLVPVSSVLRPRTAGGKYHFSDGMHFFLLAGDPPIPPTHPPLHTEQRGGGGGGRMSRSTPRPSTADPSGGGGGRRRRRHRGGDGEGESSGGGGSGSGGMSQTGKLEAVVELLRNKLQVAEDEINGLNNVGYALFSCLFVSVLFALRG